MIAFLKGQILSIGLDSAVLDVSGVGYEIVCSQNTLGNLRLGETSAVHAYTHVREDALQIYGFQSLSEKELFLSLLKVNGVGPKMAIKILSSTTVENFLNLIESGDVAGLSKLPKVGKKTAEQLVITLKGKMDFSDTVVGQSTLQNSFKEIVSALVHLGFKEVEAQKIVQDLPSSITFEEGVRRGLSSLTSQI